MWTSRDDVLFVSACASYWLAAKDATGVKKLQCSICLPSSTEGFGKKNDSFVKYIDEIKDKSTGEHDGEPLDSLMLWELYVKQFMYYSLLLLT